jgi:hypothetical protein
MRYLHFMVVHDRRQMVRWAPIRLYQYLIVNQPVLEFNFPVNHVVHRRRRRVIRNLAYVLHIYNLKDTFNRIVKGIPFVKLALI